MLFSEIIGYEDIKQRLYKTIKTGRISHAQMFVGDDGTPKLSLALAYAQLLNCEKPDGLNACGTCKSCRKYNKLIHPDLHFIFPIVKTPKISKPVSADFLDKWRQFVFSTKYHSFDDWLDTLETGNLQASIYAHESAEIIRITNLKTFEAKFKVLIIYMPEKMNTVTANKLLKVLEEPPENTLFLLIAENQEQILTTIRSRTQILKIRRFFTDELSLALKKEFPYVNDETIISEAVAISEGNFSVAKKIILEYIENKETSISKYFDLFTKFMRLAFSRKIYEIVAFTDELSSLNKEEKKKFLIYALRVLRNNFVWQMSDNQKVIYLSKKELTFSQKFKNFINQNNIFALENEFSKAISDLERNGNDKLIFLDLLLKTSILLKK